MKKLLAMLFAAAALQAGTVTVAVAANVSYAMPDLVGAFHAHHPDTRVRTTLGSSGKLTAQIRRGAPFDVFMAANMRYPAALFADGSAVTKPAVYAEGSLALFGRKPHDFSRGLALLENPAVRRVAVANPKSAPYGAAAVKALKNAGLFERIKPKLVYAESASQAVSYAMTAADVGFVAKSSLFAPKMRRFKEGKNWAEVDPKLYTPIEQGIVLLKRAETNTEAKAFYDFVLSEAGRKILRRYGYRLP